MAVTERLRHQLLDRLTDELRAFVAEQQLRLTVDEPDHSGPVHADHGVGRRCEERLERHPDPAQDGHLMAHVVGVGRR